MKKFYPSYNLRAEMPGETVSSLTFMVGGRGGVQWTAVTDGLPTTAVVAVTWARRAGLPPVVWVECDRPKASKELLGAVLHEAGTPKEYIEELVAHATTMVHVLLLGGSIYHLNVAFHHIEVKGRERPHSRAWEVNSLPCRGGQSCQP